MEEENEKYSSTGTLDGFPGCPTSEHLIALQRYIGNKWINLGRKLKLAEPELDNIEHDFATRGQREFGLQVMYFWKERDGENAKIEILIQALVDSLVDKNAIKKVFPDFDIPEHSDDFERGCPTSEHLIALQRYIGDKWINLGRKLKLTKAELQNIEHDFATRGQREFGLQVMYFWKERNGEDAKTEILIQALVESFVDRNAIEKVFPGHFIPTSNDDIEPDSYLPLSITPCSISEKIPMHEESYTNEDIYHHIRKKLLHLKYVPLPNTSWLVGKILPLEKLYVELEMYEKDDFNEEKSGVNIALNEIFDKVNGEKPTRILIEGNPGYGKTTLIYKLFLDWIKKENYINFFELIFIISLREFKGSLDEYFCQQILTDKFSACLRGISKETKLSLLKKYEKSILLLLDGYDELSENSKKELSSLLTENKYPLMTVVITSRLGQFHIPLCSDLASNLYQENDNNIFWQKRIQVKGISENKREEFLQNYFGENFSIEDRLKPGIAQKINELFECPLYLLLVAHTLEKEKENEISSRTRLYKKAVNFLMKRNLIRESVMKENEILDVFEINPNNEYRNLVLRFGKLALQMLKENRLFIREGDILKYFNNVSSLIQLGFVIKNIRIFDYQETDNYEVVHKTFMEFLAAVYLESVADDPEKIEDVYSEICTLLSADITPINNEMFYAFLSGLFVRTNNFLKILYHWKFIYPITRDPMKNFLFEKDDLDVSNISYSVPTYWVMDDKSRNFPKTKFHTSLLRYGLRNGLIHMVKWSVHCVIYIPRIVSFPYLVLDISETSQGKLKKVIEKLRNIQNRSIICNHLHCRFFSFDESIQEPLDTLFSFIHPRLNISVSIYEVENKLNTLLTFIQNCLTNLWSGKKLTALSIYKSDTKSIKQSEERLIELITNYISKGVGLHLVSSCISDEQKEIEKVIHSIGKSSSINEFAFALHKSESTFVLDLNLLCPSSSSNRWKFLSFDGNIVVKNYSSSFRIDKIAFLWKRNRIDLDVDFIRSSRNLTELKCEVAILKDLVSSSDDWSGFSSVTNLQLILIHNTFIPTDLNILTRFNTLQHLSVELANLRNPSFFGDIPHILLNILPKMKLQMFSIRRVEQRAIIFLIRLLKGILLEHLTLFRELKIWVTCDANEDLKECFKLIKQLLLENLITKFSLTELRDFNSQEELIRKLFDIRHFKIERTVEPVETKDVILSCRDVTYKEHITETISIQVIEK